ncbi:heparinase II/III domain-containing protein [Halomonas sp. E14]|uniref:heparinase II/III domain-containing protein n=1 Tax=Halomonas sp. E14 TaxID=3397245 RepID=UPI00403ECAB8
MNKVELVPVECFLHRIFPPGEYEGTCKDIVKNRVFKPRKDCDAVHLNFPIDWEATEKKEDRNWRMQLQGWTFFHPIMNFFDTYDDKNELVSYFLDVFCDWYSAYGNDPSDTTTTRMPSSYAWYDMSVGFRALILAFFKNRTDVYELKLSEKEELLLLKLAEKHVANLTTEATFSLNNHGVFQIQGLMGLLHTFQLGDKTNYSYAMRKMEDLVQSQFDANGIHLEHSPHYHFYVLATFNAVVKSGWYGESNIIIPRLQKAEEAKKWLVDPLKRPLCFGDSILTEQKTVEFPQASGDYLLSDFSSSGYAIIRSPWDEAPGKASMLSLSAAYHSKSHKHRDCMSFEWFDHGKKIICDSGKYGYRSDKYRNYFLSSRAHNSVEIEGFDILKIKPYGSAVKAVEAQESGIFKITAGIEYPAIKFTRELYFKPGAWVVVKDNLDFAREREFTQWFHFNKDYSIKKATGSHVWLLGEKDNQVYIDCLNQKVQPEIYYGDEDEMQGFLCEKDYQYTPSIALGFSGNAKKSIVTTVLSLGKEKREEALDFVARKIEKRSSLSGIIKKVPPANIIKNIQHETFLPAEEIKLTQGERTYCVYVSGVPLYFYARLNNKGRILILLPGATNRKKGHIDFQRYSWASDFEEHDVLSFSDPTINEENNLSIGWFQNTQENYGIDALIDLIKLILETGGYKEKNMVLFGSSAGGFAALKVSNAFPSAIAIAINPQLYLYNYTPSHYTSMLNYSYQNLSEKEVLRKFKDRLIAKLDFNTRQAPAFLFQNIHDEAHLYRHLKPMIKELGDGVNEESYGSNSINQSLLNVIYYEDQGSGHSPPGKEMTVQMINSVIKNNILRG